MFPLSPSGRRNSSNHPQEGFYIDEEGSHSEEEEGNSEEGSCEGDGSLAGLLAKIPKLNQTQELAATTFLTSPKESLVLVQG